MGYTHYWNQSRDFTDQEWDEALKGLLKILLVAKAESLNLGDAHGTPGSTPEINSDGAIAFNGIGEDAHETFAIDKQRWSADGFNFCKTAYKPYDTVVVACLTFLDTFAHIDVSSDGEPHDWVGGRLLAEQALGRPLDNPIKGDDGEDS